MKQTLSQRVSGDIDKKMFKLGELLDVHPEKAPQILRISAWLIRFRKEVSGCDN